MVLALTRSNTDCPDRRHSDRRGEATFLAAPASDRTIGSQASARRRAYWILGITAGTPILHHLAPAPVQEYESEGSSFGDMGREQQPVSRIATQLTQWAAAEARLNKIRHRLRPPRDNFNCQPSKRGAVCGSNFRWPWSN